VGEKLTEGYDCTFNRWLGRDESITSYANLIATYPAAVGYRGWFAIIFGPAGSRDRIYICLKSDANVYSWVEIVNGGI
jgi:hypothetical protein